MLFWTSISIAHLAAFCGFVFSCIPQKYTQLCATKSRVVIPLPAFVAVWSVATAPANIQSGVGRTVSAWDEYQRASFLPDGRNCCESSVCNGYGICLKNRLPGFDSH